MKTGVQIYPYSLDSRFRGNDEKEDIRAFYGTINLDGFVKNLKVVTPVKTGVQN